MCSTVLLLIPSQKCYDKYRIHHVTLNVCIEQRWTQQRNKTKGNSENNTKKEEHQTQYIQFHRTIKKKAHTNQVDGLYICFLLRLSCVWWRRPLFILYTHQVFVQSTFHDSHKYMDSVSKWVYKTWVYRIVFGVFDTYIFQNEIEC